jgi:phage pi2 protein 07
MTYILEKIMNQDSQKRRLKQLIEQAHDILKKTTIKNEFDINRSFFIEDGQHLFDRWKNSSKKLLDSISEHDYNSFVALEKPRLMDEQPKILKRLIPILESSLDDLNEGIILAEKQISHSNHIYIGNAENVAIGNTNSRINQVSTDTVNVIKGDFESLAEQLKIYGLEFNQIQELRTIIEENPSSQSIDGYGDSLKIWLGTLGGSIATELVVESIKMFAGF